MSTNPFTEPVSEKEFNGYWIPRHNAKVMKAGIENNNAPFLPNAYGQIKAEPVINAATGYCLPAPRLIPAQFVKNEKGLTSGFVTTKSIMDEVGAKPKEGEKALFYNFKNEEGEICTASYFFPEQTDNYQAIFDKAMLNVKPAENLNSVTIAIANSEPEEYLASYIAACKTGMTVTASPDVAEDFKKKMLVTLNNDLLKNEEKDTSIKSMNEILFNADKRSTEIIKTLSNSQNPNRTVAEPKKKQEMEIDLF